MVRLTGEEADVLFKGKTPHEIYQIAWDQVVNAPRARINDLHDTVIWLVEQRYLTEADLKAIEDDPSEAISTNGRR